MEIFNYALADIVEGVVAVTSVVFSVGHARRASSLSRSPTPLSVFLSWLALQMCPLPFQLPVQRHHIGLRPPYPLVR